MAAQSISRIQLADQQLKILNLQYAVLSERPVSGDNRNLYWQTFAKINVNLRHRSTAMLRCILIVLLFLGAYQTAGAAVIRIADGDCEGLSAAINASPDSTAVSSTTILLARNGSYLSCNLTASGGTNLVIDGQGSTVGLSYLYFAGVVTLRNLTIGPMTNPTGTSCGRTIAMDAFAVPSAVICNFFGVLTLDTVSFRDIELANGHATGKGYVPVLIANWGGELILRNVTVANLRQANTDDTATFSAIVNAGGNLQILNSTLVNVQPKFATQNLGPVIYNSPGYFTSEVTGIYNSLFSQNSGPACGQTVQGMGGNVASESSCGFSTSTGDRIVVDAGLGTLDNHGGLIATQAISGGSPAHGAGLAQYCEALDARGYTRSPSGCDSGAFEYGGGSGQLTANGMNGAYYDASADGHYVLLQRIHDNGDILVVWNTFDHNGNQAWIYGVGSLSGQHIHANMSQNIGGVLQAGGPAIGSKVRDWGAVDIDLSSCLLAQFNYQSSLPAFGAGQFPLTRLALTSDFGCSQ